MRPTTRNSAAGLCEFSKALLRAGGPAITFDWVADIEISAHSRRFIQLSDHGIIIPDAADLSVLRGLEPIHMVLAGVVCSTVSSLNAHRSKEVNCVRSRTKGTGSTWGYMCDHVVQHAVPIAVVENAPQFDKAVDMSDDNDDSPMIAASAEFCKSGYGMISRMHKVISVGDRVKSMSRSVAGLEGQEHIISAAHRPQRATSDHPQPRQGPVRLHQNRSRDTLEGTRPCADVS